ncbi:MAG: SGNH/GDSL hydrolase family protein [Oscillospiraceae bacterium]|nr:SGNH/GDSL hydrolase family protein [Oscillospiraceae bacterium]MBQ8835758.1 SGNH/GDSL hydrolase family protein [Oscillospiraceae bacterium]
MKRCLFLLCVLVVLGLLQALLIPKYMETTPEGALVGEYYVNSGGNDVIFIGDCEVYENFSPVTLWQEYGIPSYIRGSAQQMIWQSYYLLEETLQYETPKVVVFNVLSMKYDTPESTGSPTRREAYNRMTLDTMRWSPTKWKAIAASLTEEEREWEGLLTYLFPILRYHERWSQLTAEDFAYWLRRDTVSHNGYLMQTGVKPMTDSYASAPLADYRFGENSWHYLDKMRLLCEEKGVQLVLIKAPTLYPIWWWEWDAQIAQYAEENGLLYLNMIESIEDIGIDWNTDTYDAGLHLNVWGAEKAARWLGEVLREECNLPDRREDAELSATWSKKVALYEQEKQSRGGS